MEEWRDIAKAWCEEYGFYDISRRLAFVPDDILMEVLFETPLKAEQILTENGY